MSLRESIQNARTLSGGVIRVGKSNAPDETGQRKPYFADATRRYMEKMDKYSTNYFDAEVQGLNTSDRTEKKWYHIRVAEVISNAVVGTNLFDGWKTVYFEDPSIDYVPRGTRFFFWNSIWIAVNPSNIGSVSGNAIIRQCDSVWGTLDYYGNAVYVPFVRARQQAKATDNNAQQYTLIAEHYFDSIMPMDEVSANLRENTRMLLGSAAYYVTGLNDSSREFTGDASSVRLLYFTLNRCEQTINDDLERGIADGKAFSWEITVSGGGPLMEGQSEQLCATSLRNGDTPVGDISYTWESSDPSILSVDRNGLVAAISTGTAEIICRLKQNQSITQTVSVTVEKAAKEEVRFSGTTPVSLKQYASVTLSAALWRDGMETGETVEFEIAGAPAQCYETEMNGNSVTITCYYPSEIGITIMAKCGTARAVKQIALTGF